MPTTWLGPQQAGPRGGGERKGKEKWAFGQKEGGGVLSLFFFYFPFFYSKVIFKRILRTIKYKPKAINTK